MKRGINVSLLHKIGEFFWLLHVNNSRFRYFGFRGFVRLSQSS